MIDHIVNTILRYRWLTLASVLLISVVACACSTKLTVESTTGDWFTQDESLQRYNQFLDRFGSDQGILIGVFHDSIFSPAALTVLHQLSKAIEQLPQVDNVMSLANLQYLRRDGRTVELLPVIVLDEDTPGPTRVTMEGARIARQRAMESPIIRNHLVSRNERGALIRVLLKQETHPLAAQQAERRALASIRSLADHVRLGDPSSGAQVIIAGLPVVRTAMTERVWNDITTILPAGLLVVAAMTFVIYRRITAIFVPLSVMTIAFIWLVGLIGFAGSNLSIQSLPLLLLLFTISVACSIHLLSAYYQALAEKLPQAEAIRQALSTALTPCVLGCITSAVAFSSLMISEYAPIREYGLLAAISCLIVCLLCVVVVPALPCFVRPPTHSYFEAMQHSWFGRLLDFYGTSSPRLSVVVLVGALLLVIPAIAMAPRIDVTTNLLNCLRENDSVRTDTMDMESRLGGTASFLFVVETTKAGMTDGRNLAQLDKLSQELLEIDGITHVFSIIDILKEYEWAMNQREMLPRNRIYLLMNKMADNAPEKFGALVQPLGFDELDIDDPCWTRIIVRCQLSKLDQVIVNFPMIDSRLARISEMGTTDKDDTQGGYANTPAPMRVKSTGFLKLLSQVENNLVVEQKRVLGVIFIAFAVMMIVLLRSVRWGLLSMIPMGLPLVAAMDVMAAANIRLDLSSLMLATVPIGFIAHASCHWLLQMRKQPLEKDSVEHGELQSMRATGRSILVTGVILMLALLTCALGSLKATVALGLIVPLMIAVTLVAVLVILPAAVKFAVCGESRSSEATKEPSIH